MRRGRAADRDDDWGDAYASLSAAAEVFRDAAAQDPSSPRTLGNWGNALLQLGRVRNPALNFSALHSELGAVVSGCNVFACI